MNVSVSALHRGYGQRVRRLHPRAVRECSVYEVGALAFNTNSRVPFAMHEAAAGAPPDRVDLCEARRTSRGKFPCNQLTICRP
jgi:hypothetical protein